MCIVGTLAGYEYRISDVIAWFIIRLFVTACITIGRRYFIVSCKTIIWRNKDEKKC